MQVHFFTIAILYYYYCISLLLLFFTIAYTEQICADAFKALVVTTRLDKVQRSVIRQIHLCVYLILCICLSFIRKMLKVAMRDNNLNKLCVNVLFLQRLHTFVPIDSSIISLPLFPFLIRALKHK